jgi:hypothetical protein
VQAKSAAVLLIGQAARKLKLYAVLVDAVRETPLARIDRAHMRASRACERAWIRASTKNTAGQLHKALSPLVCPEGRCAFLASPRSLDARMCHYTHAHLELAPAGLEREIHLD